MKKINRTVILRIISVVLVCVMCFSAYQIYSIMKNYEKEETLHSELLEFDPNSFEISDTSSESSEQTSSKPISSKPQKKVQSISELKKKWSDTVGWITIENSQINYPFVQTNNNTKYVDRAINGSKLSAGTIFVDYRNSKDFSDFTTVLYGHHMKNGSMFGTLNRFKNKNSFKNSSGGTLFLENEKYSLEIFAFMVIKHNDQRIYDFKFESDDEKQAFLDYVKEHARNYKDISATTEDRFVILSTCDYTFENARSVLILRINK